MCIGVLSEIMNDQNMDVVVPPDSLHLSERRRKYTLDELLTECNSDAPFPTVERWEEMAPVGREVLD